MLSTAMVFFNGGMVELMKDSSKIVSSMAKAALLSQKATLWSELGEMVRAKA
jgi:hypothetical protein